MNRIAFYSHDTLGLGHLRRCLKLAHHFAHDLGPVDGLIVTGSPWWERFAPPPGFKVVPLEPVIKTRMGEYESREPALSLNEVLLRRHRSVDNALGDFEPNLLLVDNVPCGFQGEVLSSLERCRRDPDARSVLVLRDVIDDLDRIREEWSASGAPEALRDLFDEVWIFGETEEALELISQTPLAAVADKVHRCGRLAPVMESPANSSSQASDSPVVLVTGGGGRDAGPLVRTYFEAVATFSPRITSQIVLGPDFPSEALDLPTLPRVAHTHFAPDLETRIAQSDVVVSMAGYNTVCEILASGRPAVLVPRVTPREEQLIRAERLQAAGRVALVTPDQLSPATLWRAVDEMLALGSCPVPEFSGGRAAVERAVELLQQSTGGLS